MEQFANLASSTLASAYTAGSGFITVTDASSFPTSGTFTVAIGSVKLLFRVTSVSGNTFTGAAEGPDVNAAAGTSVSGTMVTVASLAQFKADVLAAVPPASNPNPFIQSLTAPVPANFSQLNFNVGASVVTTQVNNTTPANSTTIIQTDTGGTQNTAALVKNKIAATFTVTVGVSLITGAASGLGGLILYDGVTSYIFLCYQAGAGLRAPFFTTLNGGFSSDAIGPIGIWPMPQGPIAWLRVQETVSARNYFFSSDGINFIQIGTQANNAGIVTSKYGFGVQGRGAASAQFSTAITCYSFTETTP